ncbi:MAG: (Fe-S)-binding protein [Candidatus Helarchaeota archaeon]
MTEESTQEEKKAIRFKKKELFEVMLCETCMKMCTDYCCTGNVSKSELIKPNGRALVTYLHNKGIKSYDDAGINALFYCTLCEACEAHCRPNVNAPGFIRKARAQVVELGLAPEPIRELGLRVLNTNNTLNEPHEKRFSALEDLIPKKEKAEIVYFIGCFSSYREIEIARATLEILKKGNFDFCVLTDEYCCGSPLLNTGNVEVAEKVIKHNIENVKKTGCKQLVASCAACYGTWKEIYPNYSEEDFSFSVKHVVEFLLENIDKFKLNSLPKKVTYHDPCHLGRKLGFYDPPRELLKKIPNLELVEMSLNKENTTCCGAGGGFRIYNSEKSFMIGSERLEHALFTKADILSSACPLCKNQFKEVNKEDGLDVKDIIEIFNDLTS